MMRRASIAIAVLFCWPLAGQEPPAASGENCTFRADPDEFLQRQARERRGVAERTDKLGALLRAAAQPGTVAPEEIPRRNLIDVAIFDKLAASKVRSARLTTDGEFVRRVYLDVTGRVPSPDEARQFLADSDPAKRSRLIGSLLSSAEFVDKWTMWLGDLLANNSVQSNVNRQTFGRNAFHDWIRNSLGEGKSWRSMALDALTATGNNYDGAEGAVNFLIGGRAVMGPAQDIYDLMLYQTTERFLGLGHYDCLLCHDGRRHLDDLSLWGKNQTRMEAFKMAAYFSRVNVANVNQNGPAFYVNSFTVTDRATGNYALNTNFGNRPNRVRIGTVAAVDPEYRDGSKTATNWRWDLAGKVVDDPMFSTNMANRLWKALFNYALAEPVNGLDPARLDPDNPPPAPWTFQASHPQLLALLARQFRENNYDIRDLMRTMLESSAYQLSSRYDGEWNLSMVPLFARHYPRRLEGEEVHDAIVKATNVLTPYTVQGWASPTPWAMQLPEPREPLSNGTSATFMNTFLRGNRDTQQRSQSGSILQQLYLMNDTFVTTKVKVGASSTLRAAAAMTDSAAAVEELYLQFLGRRPTEPERTAAAGHLAKANNAATRNANVEDLAWALINKTEFIFSY